MEAHGLHHSLSCLLDGDFLFLAHCGSNGQWPIRLPIQPPMGISAPTPLPALQDKLGPVPLWSEDGVRGCGCRPERMMGSTSLYSRRTQMKSRAKSWKSGRQVRAHSDSQSGEPGATPLPLLTGAQPWLAQEGAGFPLQAALSLAELTAAPGNPGTHRDSTKTRDYSPPFCPRPPHATASPTAQQARLAGCRVPLLHTSE